MVRRIGRFNVASFVANFLNTSLADEINATVTMPAYRKVAGVKSCHSSTTFGGYGTTFTFTFTLLEEISPNFL